MMLKDVFIHQILKLIDYSLQEWIKKPLDLMKDELEGNTMTKFVAHRPKTVILI